METNILKDGTIKEGTPESVGIASGHIANYLMRLRDIDYDIHSLQIVKDGKLIFANASEPFMLESPHRLLSAAKAIIAAAVLFAVDEGFLSFDSKIIDYFRDKLPDTYDKRFEDITLYDLLTMQSGQNSDEAFMFFIEHPDADLCRLFFNTPMDCAPGEHFFYNNSIPHLLFFLVERATGKGIETYIHEKICVPLEIEITAQYNQYHIYDPVTTVVSANGFLKLGLWFLQYGRWNGKQLLNPELMKKACTQQTWTGLEKPGYHNGKGYCMQLWKNVFGGCRMDGGGGQIALILPEQNMVAVIMGNESRGEQAIELFYEEILSKIQGKELRRESKGIQILETAKKNMSRICCETVFNDELITAVNEKCYYFPENLWGLQSVRLSFEKERAFLNLEQGGEKKKYEAGIDPVWCENSNFLILEPDTSIQNLIYGPNPQVCKLCGGWMNDFTFIIVCKSAASMGKYIFKFEFSGRKLKLYIPGGVSGGMKQDMGYISITSV